MVRHAQTVANARGKYTSESDPLSSIGELQASLLAERLQHLPLRLIVHSGSVRTAQTAAAVAALHPCLRVEQDTRLQEGRVGEWGGKKMGRRITEAQHLGIPVRMVRPPGGESWMDIDKRIAPFMDDILAAYGSAQALIVGQGRINSLILRRIENIPWSEYAGRQQPHTGLTRIVWEDSPKVLMREDVSHLPPHLQTI